MSWLSFIGNQPILSQWNESSREQDTDLYWKKFQLKNERDLLLYTATLSDYSVFFFISPPRYAWCLLLLFSLLQEYLWSTAVLLTIRCTHSLIIFFLNIFDCWKGKPWCFSFGSRDVWNVYSVVGREDTPLALNSPLLRIFMSQVCCTRTCVPMSTARVQTLSDSVLSNQQ